MNNKPWMIASLMAASSIFAQSNSAAKCPPKAPDPMPAPMTAAYNAPSRIQVRGSWDVFVDVAFIYWQPTQDNMEMGIITSDTSDPRTMFGTVAAPVSNSLIKFSPDFKPGFQVGLGMNFDYDNWDSYLQYTWFHNTNTANSSGSGAGSIFQTYGHPNSEVAGTQDTANGKWKLKMDLLDWQLGRAYYVGTKLTFHPYFGVRAAWIRQNYNLTYVNGPDAPGDDGTFTVKNHSTSWAIGPEAGLTANYNFGYGLRMFGDFEGDLTYSRYRSSMSSDSTSSEETLSVKQSGVPTVRPHVNLDLGLGWGSYFDNNNWHIDLAASYGFQVFWDQNMFRHFNDDVMQANSIMPNGSLYIQGLNVTARLDF